MNYNRLLPKFTNLEFQNSDQMSNEVLYTNPLWKFGQHLDMNYNRLLV